ncbi:deaminase, partial [Arthrospira platensis SPKY2]
SIDSKRLETWAIGMARHVATLSKDPSSKVGAVIFDDKRRLISAGYNGFARGVVDSVERLSQRDVKYKMTIHAEVNAIMFATVPLGGCTLVVTHPCCAQCAALVIQSGIRHVMWPVPSFEFVSRWSADIALTCEQFAEAGITTHEIEEV